MTLQSENRTFEDLATFEGPRKLEDATFNRCDLLRESSFCDMEMIVSCGSGFGGRMTIPL